MCWNSILLVNCKVIAHHHKYIAWQKWISMINVPHTVFWKNIWGRQPIFDENLLWANWRKTNRDLILNLVFHNECGETLLENEWKSHGCWNYVSLRECIKPCAFWPLNLEQFGLCFRLKMYILGILIMRKTYKLWKI